MIHRQLETQILRNTATPTTPAAGQQGYSGGVLYVRLPGDANPNSHTIEAGRRNAAIITQGFGRLAVRDVAAKYCIGGAIANGLSTQPLGTGLLTVEDADLSYNGGNGLGVAGVNVDTVATNVTAHRNTNDASTSTTRQEESPTSRWMAATAPTTGTVQASLRKAHRTTAARS